MALPELLENGLLPPGLHLADLEEIWERFGKGSERRQMLFRRLQFFVELAQHVGASRMFIGGSYVTAKPDPADVDVVIWVGDTFLRLLDEGDQEALTLELVFLTREPKEAFAVFDEMGWNAWGKFFSKVRGRRDLRKGLVEVKLHGPES